MHIHNSVPPCSTLHDFSVVGTPLEAGTSLSMSHNTSKPVADCSPTSCTALVLHDKPKSAIGLPLTAMNTSVAAHIPPDGSRVILSASQDGFDPFKGDGHQERDRQRAHQEAIEREELRRHRENEQRQREHEHRRREHDQRQREHEQRRREHEQRQSEHEGLPHPPRASYGHTQTTRDDHSRNNWEQIYAVERHHGLGYQERCNDWEQIYGEERQHDNEHQEFGQDWRQIYDEECPHGQGNQPWLNDWEQIYHKQRHHSHIEPLDKHGRFNTLSDKEYIRIATKIQHARNAGYNPREIATQATRALRLVDGQPAQRRDEAEQLLK